MAEPGPTGREDRIFYRRRHNGRARSAESDRGIGTWEILNLDFRHVGHSQKSLCVRVGIPRLPVDELRPFMQGDFQPHKKHPPTVLGHCPDELWFPRR